MSRNSGSRRGENNLEVPDRIDRAERKRVLNVLAQRRYRQRKREHLKNLEAQVDEKRKDEATVVSVEPLNHEIPITLQQTPLSPDLDLICFGGDNVTSMFNEMLPSCETPQLISDESNGSWTTSMDNSPPYELWNDPGPNLEGLLTNETTNTHGSMTNPPLNNMMSPFQQLVSLMGDDAVARFDFPDEANLKVMELDLLRAAMAIARRMNVSKIIYSLDARSPYTSPTFSSLSFDHLPSNLRPTKIQMMIPHHPILDILPWPTVRNKMIVIFSQPPEERPIRAASPTSLLEFVYDIEDSSEGVRIWGDDPYSDENWEVGEKVFRNWWFVFDNQIIKHSNSLRRQRGAPVLGQGLIMGEV